MFETDFLNTVDDLVFAVSRELGGSAHSINILSSDGISYSKSFPLTKLLYSQKRIMVQVDGVLCEIEDTPAPTESTGKTSLQRLDRVDSVDGAIKLMNFVHEELKVGRCRSVNQALQIVKKDRKTVDRFKHIYYLNATDPELLKQLETDWKISGCKGGLAFLDKMCSPRVDWERLMEISRTTRGVHIFGKIPEPKHDNLMANMKYM